MKFLATAAAALLLGIGTVAAQDAQIGLVLSGGGALGFAEIGAIAALEDSGIRPNVIAGASVGALVGTFYASGLTAVQIEDICRKEHLNRRGRIIPRSWKIPKTGYASHKYLRRVLDKYIHYDSFDSLPYPLTISVTDITDEKCVYAGSGGHLKEYTLASMSMQGVIEAVDIDGHLCIDGGILDNYPALAIANQCDMIIGIDVQPPSKQGEVRTISQLLTRASFAKVAVTSAPGCEKTDYLLNSTAAEHFSFMDFGKMEALFAYGYKEMSEFIAAHPEMKQEVEKVNRYYIEAAAEAARQDSLSKVQQTQPEKKAVKKTSTKRKTTSKKK